MTVTCRDIVTAALRKARVLGDGARTPSAEQAADGMTVLQSLYEEAVDTGLFGRMAEIIATADYTANEYERVRVDGAFTVTLPTTYTDLMTGDPRTPNDLAVVVVVANNTPTRKIYDAMKGQWIALDGLTLDSEAPLADRGRDGLAAALALAWVEEFGGDVGPRTTAQAGQFKSALASIASATDGVLSYTYF